MTAAASSKTVATTSASTAESSFAALTMRTALTHFYEKVNPTKVGDVPTILASFEGQHVNMILSLEAKYPTQPTTELRAALSPEDLRMIMASSSSRNRHDGETAGGSGVATRPRASPTRSNTKGESNSNVAPFFPSRARSSTIVDASQGSLEASFGRLRALQSDIDAFDPMRMSRLAAELEQKRDAAEFEMDRVNLNRKISECHVELTNQSLQFKHAVSSIVTLVEKLIIGIRENDYQHQTHRDSGGDANEGGGVRQPPVAGGGEGSRAVVNADPTIPPSARGQLVAQGRTVLVGARDDDGSGGDVGGSAATHAPSRFSITAMDKHYLTATKQGNPDIDALLSKRTLAGVAATSSVEYTGSSLVNRVVFDVVPLGNEANIISDVILSQASPGDIIVLHPGVYYENIVVSDYLEIRPAIERKVSSGPSQDGGTSSGAGMTSDATRVAMDAGEVVIYPADPDVPCIQVIQSGRLKLSSVIVKGKRPAAVEGSSAASRKGGRGTNAADDHLTSIGVGDGVASKVPLISVSGGARAEFHNVTVSEGLGGGVVCLGNAQLKLLHGVIKNCGFAGVYAKDTSFAAMCHVRFFQCEVGVRVRSATFALEECEIREAKSDGLVVHGTAKGVIERSVFRQSTANGVLLSTSCDVLLTQCTIVENGKWGVYAPIGADFALTSCVVMSNQNGDVSRPPPIHSRFNR